MQSLLVGLVCAAAIIALLLKAGVIDVAAVRRLFQPYRARDLMTANERDMFARLVRALPDAYVFPQVGGASRFVTRTALSRTDREHAIRRGS